MDRRPVPKEKRCERCSRRAFWWLWAEGYPRHKLCANCLEPVTVKLANQPTMIGRLRHEPIER